MVAAKFSSTVYTCHLYNYSRSLTYNWLLSNHSTFWHIPKKLLTTLIPCSYMYSTHTHTHHPPVTWLHFGHLATSSHSDFRHVVTWPQIMSFLMETGVYFLFPQKLPHREQMGSLNNHGNNSTTIAKKGHKIKHRHLLSHFKTVTTYNWNYKLSYSCKWRTIFKVLSPSCIVPEGCDASGNKELQI